MGMQALGQLRLRLQEHQEPRKDLDIRSASTVLPDIVAHV